MPKPLEHYLSRWQLSDPQPLAQTITSHLYTVTYHGERVVLKLLTARGWEERTGAAALRNWNGRGAVRLLRGEDDAYLLEYAGGDDLIPLVRQGGDEQATEIIASVLNELHATTAEPFPAELESLQIWFRGLFRKAEADRRAGVASSFVRAAQIAEELLAHPLDQCVIHGDMHHENVRQSARGWLAFDPKGLVGERTYDAANTLCNPVDMPALVEDETRLLTNAAILADAMRIELPRVLAFTYAYANLSASWILADGDHPAHDLAMIALLEPHVG